NHVCQRLPLDILENRKWFAVVKTIIKYRCDRRMVQVGAHPRFFFKGLLQFAPDRMYGIYASTRRQDDLDCYRTIEPNVSSQEYLPHAASAQLVFQNIALVKGHSGRKAGVEARMSLSVDQRVAFPCFSRHQERGRQVSSRG